jgi:hypothetical protein
VLAIAISLAIATALSVVPSLIDTFVAAPGVVRTFYTQTAFRGEPRESVASEINLAFLEVESELPRQQFSARWHGFFFISEPQTVEFFAGGNDEVELRIDGELLLTRNLAEGMRTVGRSVALDAGAHELSVDFQQFGGGMALNIQRAFPGQAPSPFLSTELFTEPVNARAVWMAGVARLLRRYTPIVWVSLGLIVAGSLAARNFASWRRTSAPQSARDYAVRLQFVAAPALVGPAVVFLFGPHTIFVNNAGEFALPFEQIGTPWLMKAVVVNWVMLVGLGGIVAAFSRRAAQVYGSLLFVIGLLFWGQGNLWNADYGALTGQRIDLDPHASRAPYELAAWSAAILSALLFSRRISRIAPFASIAFLAVQAAAIALSSVGAGATRAPEWSEPPTALYQFSSARNVVHIVLDEFQSDVFTQILDQDRTTLDRQFSGFQYFSDHAGSFPTTTFSMPAMLTGQEYRNQKPAPDFVREVFKDASILGMVARAGYDVDATSIVPTDSFDEWLGPEGRPNWSGARFKIPKPFASRDDYREVTARQLAELSLFRHVPHVAKSLSVEHPDRFYRAIWMDRTESPVQVRRHEATNSVAFLEQFIDRMGVGRDRPVYKLLHVGVPHRPIVVDRECRFIGLTDMSRESYTEQSRCAVKLVAGLLDKLRALGIYDSSLIIVSSDHGTDLDLVDFAGRSPSLATIPGPSTVRLPAIVSTAKAVMLVKPPNGAGPITVSDAPTSHVDLPATILDLLGMPGATPDASMMARDPNQARTRVFGMYNPQIRFPKEYVDRIDVLTLDGRVVDGSKWNVQRLIWKPDLRLTETDVDVGPRSAHLYLGPGWSLERRERTGGSQEVTFAQALTERAIISVSLPARALEVVLRASSPRGEGPRAIRVDVDGTPAATLKPSGPGGYGDLVIPVSANAARPPVSEVTLHFDRGDREDFVFKLDRLSVRER